MSNSNGGGRSPGEHATRVRKASRNEHSLEVERSLLGAILLDAEAMVAASDLVADDFEDHRHKVLFRHLREMTEQGLPIDAVTVAQRLQEANQLDDIGGSEYLEVLMGTVPHTAHANQYATSIRVNASSRQLHSVGIEIAQRCEEGQPAAEVLASLMPTLATLEQSRTSRGVGIRANVEAFSEVTPKRLSWLWPGRIPLGMLTVVSGNPGIGKSFVTADIIARVSSGRAFPDGCTANEPGDVLLINYEDAVSEVQAARLKAADAALNRVHRIPVVQFIRDGRTHEEATFGLSYAVEVFRDALSKLLAPKLIVLDPLASFLDGVRSNDQGDVRAVLDPLAQLAQERRIAVVVVCHDRKGTGSHASARLAGSVQFGATARAIWQVYTDKDDPMRRLFLCGKNSNGRDIGGLAFRVVDSEFEQSDDGSFVGRVEWEPDAVNMTADARAELAADGVGVGSERRPVKWLRERLADGPLAHKQISNDAHEAGITPKQLTTAKTQLRIRPQKSGFEGGWVWELPHPEDARAEVQETQDDQP